MAKKKLAILLCSVVCVMLLIYERYNVTRLLVANNVWQYYLDTFYADVNVTTANTSMKIARQYQKQLKKWIRQADIVYYK